MLHHDSEHIFDYLSLNSQARTATNLSLAAGIGGSASSTSDEFISKLSQHVQDSEHTDLAAKWLDSSQIDGYLGCLERTSPGVYGWIASWSDKTVIVSIRYQPPGTTDFGIYQRYWTLPLRQAVTVKGATDEWIAQLHLNSSPVKENIYANTQQSIDIPRRDGVETIVDIDTPFKQLHFSVPPTPKLPCIAVDDIGKCTAVLVQFTVSTSDHAPHNEEFPAEWNGRPIYVDAILKISGHSEGSYIRA